MFEALVITLREGVEAAMVLAIALAILKRRGLERLNGALYAGAAIAIAVSVAIAAALTRLDYNQEIAEGAAKLIGAVLVLTLVAWMWKAAPRMKSEIESGIERAARGGAGTTFALALFAFGMVFREGVETAIFLSAAEFNSQGLGLLLGAAIGLALAIAFGVMFVRGTLRIPLKPFFSITSAVLILIGVQLLIGGLHEFSEAEILPSSRAEMALIGPIVKNELLLFTLTVALAAGWLLFGPRGAASPARAAATGGPQARLERAAGAREASRRRWTAVIALVVVGALTTAFVQSSKLPGKAPAQPVTFANGLASIDAGALGDHHLHFYSATLPEGEVRFFAVGVGDEIRTCFDACEICGDKGYFEDGGAVVCRNCTSPIVLGSLGRTGGCNPIPLAHRLESGHLVVAESDLRAALPKLKGR
jgi:FTR1 family protein